MQLVKSIEKIGVLAGNCDGFIGNRMFQFYTGEAEFLLEDGATPEQIDRERQRVHEKLFGGVSPSAAPAVAVAAAK